MINLTHVALLYTGRMQLIMPSVATVRRLAAAAVVLNILLIVTGGAVRLTDSGLGCPTWPNCTDGSLVTTPELGAHGIIEFGNRLLGVGLELLGIALLLVVLKLRKAVPASWRLLAVVQVLVVPAQALVGGILVLTDLNPYVRLLHFLISFPITFAALALLRRAVDGPNLRVPLVRAEMRWLLGGLLVVTVAVIVIGSVVTGAGPHGGDPTADRLAFDLDTVTRIHADLTYLLVGLVAATAIVSRPLCATGSARRSIAVLVVLLPAQAILGYAQHHLGVPPLLVGLHMLGAALIFTAAAWAYFSSFGVAPAVVAGEDQTTDGVNAHLATVPHHRNNDESIRLQAT